MAGMPIYSQVVPKSQHRGKSGPKKERPQNLPREFDPLNYNHGGNFQLVNATERVERMEKKESRRKEDSSRTRKIRNENDGKVEAYLRQNQVSMRQQQRHSAVKQAEHRMNLRSLPLNEVATSRGQERTPTDRRLFPGERDGNREHRRERERDRDRDNLDFDASPLSPNSRDKPSNRAIRKSSSAHRVTEPAIAMDKRRFFCREWAFQKIAHCLEQRPVSKTCGALILGDAGSGKTALCQELSSPQQTPQARQQRALNRRLLARHFLQGNTESSLRPDEFIRSLAMQILSHGLAKLGSSERKSDNRNEHSDNRYSATVWRNSARQNASLTTETNILTTGKCHTYMYKGVRSLAMQILSHGLAKLGSSERKSDNRNEHSDNRNNSEEERLCNRFRDLSGGDDGEESSKPLLADSEDQRTDEEDTGSVGIKATSEPARGTMHRIHEREQYLDAIVDNNVPEILPRATVQPTNPFLTDDQRDDFRLYENHENVFLRNVSQRQSKELRNSRLVRQSSEPLSDKKPSILQKSLSTEQKSEEERKVENSPPKSRIPVANFRYPNKNEPKLSSAEGSPLKKQETDKKDSLNDSAEEKSQQENGTDSVPQENGDSKSETENNGPVAADADNGETVKDGEELPEYQNVMMPELREEDKIKVELEILLEKKRSESNSSPPPIPVLPVSPRELIANSYYEKLLAEPDIQLALLPHNLEKNPDESFKKALLFPLLEIDPPKQCLFLLIDAIDEGLQPGQQSDSRSPSRTVAELVSRHQHLLPQWLLLVCTARRHCKLTRMFTGFRKITLDELARAHVSADVQRYVLSRLDTEPKLRARVSHDGSAAAAAAAALDHLRIKSDGCLLYLEKVLDGVADGFIALREIREIPGTLNGLYLWLAQRLFHGRRFAKVRLLLDVLLAARCGVTEEMLYKCLLTKEYSVTREDFNRRLHLLRRIVVMERATGYVQIFHHSFAAWLLDVKHCTRRYLCSLSDGHAALAMYYTLMCGRRYLCSLSDGHAALAMYYTLMCGRLSAMEINNYVFHMTHLEQHLLAQKKSKDNEDEVLDLHTIILLWVLDSGCDLESALKRENDALRVAIIDDQNLEAKTEDKEEGSDCEDKETNSERVSLEKLMPGLKAEGNQVSGGRAADARALAALLQLRPHPSQTNCVSEEMAESTEPTVEEEEPIPLDPNIVFELATSGDHDALASVLKRNPALISAVDATGGTALHSAARAGRAAAVRVICAAGADAQAPDNDGWSPLRAAAWAGHPDVVDVLLEYGCDVDCVDGDNRTALRAAAWSGHEAVVRRLLAAGAAPERADAEGRTALMAAAYMGHADIVKALLLAGADPNHADADGRTALSVACLCGSGVACAQLLVERGADVNAADRDRATPLLVAAFEGHTEICELLLENEADIEATDAMGRTALWAAAAAGHAPTVRLLLFWGACVDNMDGEGRTVLSAAAAQGNVEVVRQLLDRGLDEHHRDNSGWTPLHYAAFEGHIEVCEALLEAGAAVDEADNDGKGALMLCAQEGHTTLAEVLLDKWGAHPDQRAHDGKTALRLAALEGHFETVQALFRRGADVDALDADRRSTLYVLALDNRLAMARRLIGECGASVTSTDTEGRTPLHVSAWQGHNDMVNLLIKVGGADVDGRDRCRRTALHAAAWRGRAAVLRTLLTCGADPHAVCTQGATPLGIAAQEGHEECVLWLLQHGADPLQADHCGRTPAKVAWRAGHANICRLLERWAAPPAPSAPLLPTLQATVDTPHTTNSPEHKRRSVHSSNSTKSSNLSHDPPDLTAHEQASRANLSLSFAQQVARVGRGRRERERDSAILEHQVMEKAEKDSKLRSYAANERDADLRGYARERDSRREERHGYSGCERDNMSPLYASPPRSPLSDICSPTQPNVAFGSQPPSLVSVPAASAHPAGAGAGNADTHFHRDTHMRIILGREKPSNDRHDSNVIWRSRYSRLVGSIGRARGKIFKKTKNKRNGIVTNPAMRLVNNVRNGLDSAAANIRRTGVALAASASSANPVVKTNAFQWRKETPL